jgi:tetratricopeptide (TPR) repeat protein
MGFAGNLRTLSLVEVFQTINRIQATGVLRLASDKGGRDLVFDNGGIIGVAFRSGEQKQALLRRLILQGKLDANSAASLSGTGQESQLVQAMVSNGWLSQDEVDEAYSGQAEDELASLCTWEYADFVFEDAGPEQPLATQLVERFRKRPLGMNMNHLLIEAARRTDDWARLRQAVPSEATIYGLAEGGEATLREIEATYPGSAVAPLIDGGRAVEDIIAESVATRLDVYQVLADLVTRQAVVPLAREHLLANADHQAASGDYKRAAHLYRRLLHDSPNDRETAGKLAGCLDHLGDPAESAACYAQLALEHLDQQEGEKALSYARHAVKLMPKDPAKRLALVRCLMWAQQTKEATAELRQVSAIYIGLGQLEEARGTCLKILAIDPADDEARRQLARIFSRVEKDPTAEDVVVCVQCQHVNHREAQVCAKCQAPLQLTCLSCGHVVAVSDRLCIFCGAEPHNGNAAKREPVGQVQTSTFAKSDRIAKKVEETAPTTEAKTEVSSQVEIARAHERAGRYAEALAQWRDLAAAQPDNNDLQKHIREVQVKVTEQVIEGLIERGHVMRKSRRFWRAANCYKDALRLLSRDDPRRAPLGEILKATATSQRRNLMLFAAAFAVFGVLGYLVAKPYIDLNKFLKQVDADAALLDPLPTQGGSAVKPASDALADLERAVATLSHHNHIFERGQAALDDFTGSYHNAVTAAAKHDFEDITQSIDRGDIAPGLAKIENFRRTFGPSMLELPIKAQQVRVEKLKADLDAHNADLKEGPIKLAAAKAREDAGALGEALALYLPLAAMPEVEINGPATIEVGKLQDQQNAFHADLAKADALSPDDAAAAATAYAALQKRAEVWGEGDAVTKKHDACVARLKAATDDWAATPKDATIAELQIFIDHHGGTPEYDLAKIRLSTAKTQANLRLDAVARYKALMDQKDWEKAWQAAHDLVLQYGRSLDQGEVSFPLQLDTTPEGAAVTRDGHQVGTTPCTFQYPPGDKGSLTLTLPSWKPVTIPIDGEDWHHQETLIRLSRWTLNLGKYIGGAQSLASSATAAAAAAANGNAAWLVLSGESTTGVSDSGQALWSLPYVGQAVVNSHATATGHTLFLHLPLLLADGGLVAGLPGANVELVDAKGQLSQTLNTENEVFGRPVVYANGIFGDKQRLAFAAEKLYSGPLGDTPTAIPLTAQAISGPLALAKDIDVMLVLCDDRGHLIAIEESTKTTLWDKDQHIAECGQMLLYSNDQAAMVFDSARLVAFKFTPAGADQQWNQRLPANAVGEPLLANGIISVAAGNTVCRFTLAGAPLPVLTLPGQITAFAGVDDRIAVACQDGTLHVFKGADQVWTTPTSAVVTGLAMSPTGILAGQADGQIEVFDP